MKRPLALALLSLLSADAWFARHPTSKHSGSLFPTKGHPTFVVLEAVQSESSQKDTNEYPAVSSGREEQEKVIECNVACDPTCIVADFPAFF
jgi:ABC-type dipeptide/oligopeptide/nickel transport system ATPase component